MSEILTFDPDDNLDQFEESDDCTGLGAVLRVEGIGKNDPDVVIFEQDESSQEED